MNSAPKATFSQAIIDRALAGTLDCSSKKHPDKVKVMLRIPRDLYDRLKQTADELRLPMNQLFVAALAEAIAWPVPNPRGRGRPKYRESEEDG